MNIVSVLPSPLVSWIESLAIFKPSNLKLFLLIALKSVKEFYKAAIQGIPMALVSSLLLMVLSNFMSARLEFSSVTAFIFIFLMQAIRPSVAKKNIRYWFSAKTFALWFIVTLLVYPASSFIDYLYKTSFEFGWLIYSIIVLPFFLIWTLFLLDAQLSLSEIIKTPFRALKMIVYNVPFFGIMFLGLMLLELIIEAIVFLPIADAGSKYIFMFILLLLIFLILFVLPFFLCFVVNFYVKRIHEQFSLYY